MVNYACKQLFHWLKVTQSTMESKREGHGEFFVMKTQYPFFCLCKSLCNLKETQSTMESKKERHGEFFLMKTQCPSFCLYESLCNLKRKAILSTKTVPLPV